MAKKPNKSAAKQPPAGVVPKLEANLNPDEDLDGNILEGDLGESDYLTREETDLLHDAALRRERETPSLDPDANEDDFDEEETKQADSDEDDDNASEEEEFSEEDEEPEKEKYGRKVRERIERERRLKAQARREAEDAARRVREYEEKLDKLEAEKLERDKQLYEMAETTQGDRIKLLNAALLQAKQEGRYEDEVEIQNQLGDAYAIARNAKAGKEQKEREIKERLEKKKEPSQQEQPIQSLPDAAQKWLSRNKWFNEAGSERERRYVQHVLRPELEERGYDWRDPDFYEELNRELYKVFPNRNRKAQARENMADERARRPNLPTAPVSRENSDRKSAKDPRAQLTKLDIARMKQMGININDKETVAYYLRSKTNNVMR